MRRVLWLVVALAFLTVFGCASSGSVTLTWETSVTLDQVRPAVEG